MSSYDSELFNTSPYYDDFNEDKKFLRMLFRPGYAVQSRELTQLQTILQNQIERFGNHIFKDGSRIIGGEISTQTLDFVRLLPSTVASPSATLTAEDIVGNNLIQVDGSGNVVAKAKVLDFLATYSDSDRYAVAIVSYLSGVTFTAGSTLTTDATPASVVTVAPSSSTVPHGGKSKVISVGGGIYYINGSFVKTDNQLEPAYQVTNFIRDFSTPTGVMGFDVRNTIVTEKDDYTIKDPANGSYNYNAPGAHRYKIDLVLSFVDSPSENFISLVNYIGGTVVKKYDYTQYSDIMDLFAKRTYEESGNYVSSNFDITFKEGGDTFAYAEINAGKAYVYGYEYESRFKDIIEIPKARTTADFTNIRTNNFYGNYIRGNYDRTCNLTVPLQNTEVDDYTVQYEIYGATAALTVGEFGIGGFVNNAEKLAFTTWLVSAEPIVSSTTYSSNNNSSIPFVARISHYSPKGLTATNEHPLNLYYVNRKTFVSTKLLSNITVEQGTAVPVVTAPNQRTLLYPLNSNASTTMIKTVDSLEYIREASISFSWADGTRSKDVLLNLGSDYNWCTSTGEVPDGSPVSIDAADGYYLLNNDSGLMYRVVLPTTELLPETLRVTGVISADGDRVRISASGLTAGQYWLVGKTKYKTQGGQNLSAIRTKTLTDAVDTFIPNTDGSNRVNNNAWQRLIISDDSGNPSQILFRLTNTDVNSIQSIVDSTGLDITNRFRFHTGQQDSFYSWGVLYVKPEYLYLYKAGTTFNFTVTYKYFRHSGSGPFVANSYAGISYENIPTYVSPTSGKAYQLANMVDFRHNLVIKGYVPIRSTGAPGTFVSGTNAPSADNRVAVKHVGGVHTMQNSIRNDHEAYLPRIDKIAISRNIAADGDDTTVFRIPGSANESPVAPEDLRDAMTLYSISVPAYTFNAADIKGEGAGVDRFTMKDINDLSDRIDNLEQFAVLSDLEASIASTDLTLSNGNEGIKRAILVDAFEGHSIGDVMNEDYRCSVDFEHGELRPAFISDAFKFEYTGVDAGTTTTIDNIFCASYTQHATPVAAQQKASSRIKVNQFGLPNWVGQLKITPHADYWYDTIRRPYIKNNDTGRNDAWVSSDMGRKLPISADLYPDDVYTKGHGTQWADWESNWSGIAVDVDAERKANNKFFSTARKKESAVTGIQEAFRARDQVTRFTEESQQNRKDTLSFDIRTDKNYLNIASDTILNQSVIPYVREKPIAISAYNMKPKTNVYVFFDNTNITSQCTLNGVSGSTYFTTSDDGSLLNVQYTIAPGTFLVGEKGVRIIDDSNGVIANATTIAEGIYSVVGIKKDNPIDVASIRLPELRRHTPSSNKFVSNPLQRGKNFNSTKYDQWIDPLAQTFLVDSNEHPDGIYLESVDLYFSEKDSTLPVTIEICPTVSGLPQTSYIVPFSTVVKSPSNVVVDNTKPVATNFKFSSPVYLQPGQYAILIRANTTKYSLFAASIGEKDITTGQRISSTFMGGSLFNASNSDIGSADQSTDLTFKLNRCQFSSVNNVTLENALPPKARLVAILQPNLYAFTPPNVSLITTINIGGSNYSATLYRNFVLPEERTVDDAGDIDLQLTVSNQSQGKNTFMVDLDRSNIVGVGYVVKNVVSSSNTTSELAPFSGSIDDTARYITREMKIPNRQKAKELKVVFDTNNPKNTKVDVYAKTYIFGTGDATGELGRPYSALTLDTTSGFYQDNSFVSGTNPSDFREVSYTLSGVSDFDTFAVKICLYTDNKAIVPVIKNLKVVALS